MCANPECAVVSQICLMATLFGTTILCIAYKIIVSFAGRTDSPDSSCSEWKPANRKRTIKTKSSRYKRNRSGNFVFSLSIGEFIHAGWPFGVRRLHELLFTNGIVGRSFVLTPFKYRYRYITDTVNPKRKEKCMQAFRFICIHSLLKSCVLNSNPNIGTCDTSTIYSYCKFSLYIGWNNGIYRCSKRKPWAMCCWTF